MVFKFKGLVLCLVVLFTLTFSVVASETEEETQNQWRFLVGGGMYGPYADQMEEDITPLIKNAYALYEQNKFDEVAELIRSVDLSALKIHEGLYQSRVKVLEDLAKGIENRAEYAKDHVKTIDAQLKVRDDLDKVGLVSGNVWVSYEMGYYIGFEDELPANRIELWKMVEGERKYTSEYSFEQLYKAIVALDVVRALVLMKDKYGLSYISNYYTGASELHDLYFDSYGLSHTVEEVNACKDEMREYCREDFMTKGITKDEVKLCAKMVFINRCGKQP